MRIGEFAKKFDINASAVRFYIDKAIITPKRSNGLYIFDDACVEQMSKIIHYKKCGFSLEEIELLCYYEKTTKLKDGAVNREILKIFRDKEDQVKNEIQERENIIQLLKEEIKSREQKAEEITEIKHTNIPVEALNVVCCPRCDKRLSLLNADIDESGVVKGDFKCKCGYSINIADGIIICEGSNEETPFKAFENIDSILAITDDFSPAYRELIDKAHLWMYQSIASSNIPLKIVMVGPFSYNFILKYLEELPDEPLYIIADVSVRKLRKIQDYFTDTKKKILFISGEMKELPIMKCCIDLYIDDFSSSNYIFTYSANLFKYIAPLIKTGGVLTGQFVDYSMAPRSLENFKKDHENFASDLMRLHKIYDSFSKEGLKIIEECNCGSTRGNIKDFARNVIGEQVTVMAYFAKKC